MIVVHLTLLLCLQCRLWLVTHKGMGRNFFTAFLIGNWEGLFKPLGLKDFLTLHCSSEDCGIGLGVVV